MQLENNDVEGAITAFIAGLDRGYVKCAYGVIHTVMTQGSYMMTEDEAISIFTSNYPDLRLLAEYGDTEAMVMVAEGIRYGFVEDSEPYLYWLNMAAEKGDADAVEIMKELGADDDPFDDPIMVPNALNGDSVDELELPTDTAPIAEPDHEMREELGLNAMAKEKKRKVDLDVSRGTAFIDDLVDFLDW